MALLLELIEDQSSLGNMELVLAVIVAHDQGWYNVSRDRYMLLLSVDP